MKLRTALVLALTAIVGQGQALTVSQVNDANTLHVYVAGTSITKPILKVLFAQNCKQTTPGTYDDLTTFSSKQGSIAGLGDAAHGMSYNTYTCTLKSGSAFGASFDGKKIAFHKRDRDGAPLGVFPVAQNIPINFQEISASSCDEPNALDGGNGSKIVLCSNLISHKPDGGISDVEPTMFTASGNATQFSSLSPAEPVSFVPTSTFSGTGPTGTAFQSGSLQAIFQIPYGLAVNQRLYADLQAAQGTAGQPSIPFAIASSIFRSGSSWSIGWKALGLARPDSQVTICRHKSGSGTQAAANFYFGYYPLTAVTPLVSGDSTANVATTTSGEVDLTNAANFTQPGQLLVVENSNSSGVRNCLAAANNAGTYAIGHISLEAGFSGPGWNLVKIDGAIPSRSNVQNGSYFYWYESTCQVNKFAGNAATAITSNDQKSFMGSVCRQLGLPKNLAAVGLPNTYPRLAISGLPNGRSSTSTGTFDGCSAVAAYPATTSDLVVGSSSVTVSPEQAEFCGRMSRSGHSQGVPILYK
jgi:hypothetical protein